MDSNTFFLLVVIVLGIVAILLTVFGSKITKGLSPTSMYNISACLIVANIISCTISFAALSLALSGNISCSNQDVVVDILSVLVTVLMGWNIISVVDVKREASRINSVSKDMESVVRSILQLSIHSFTMRSDKEAVIDSCFNSLNILKSCEDNQIKCSLQNEIMEVLHYIHTQFSESNSIRVYGLKDHYKYILKHTDSPYTEEIGDMIDQAETTSRQEVINFASDSTQNNDFSLTGN